MSKLRTRAFPFASALSNNLLRCVTVFALFALLLPLAITANSGGKSYFVYIGTYTHTASKGIYAYRFSPATGDILSLGLIRLI